MKVAVTGPIGSGKTCFGLDAKNHGLGPVAVLSLEAGDVQYAKSQRWGGFKVIRTQDIGSLRDGVEWLEKNPGTYGTLVVDTVTGIYEAVVDAKMKEDGSLNRNSWGLVKRAWKSLMLRLVNLPMHVVFVVHELDVTQTDKVTGDTSVVGHKLDAEKTFGRAPDFVIRMTGIDGQKTRAEVLKIRGEETGFSVGQKLSEPHLGMFVAAIKKGEEARVSTPEEVKDANEAALGPVAAQADAAKPVPDRTSDELVASTLQAACKAGFNADIHRKRWLGKHKAEIEGLKARHPDLYIAVKAAYDAAHVKSTTQEEAA